MGEYCYEYEVNSPVLKSLVGERVVSFTAGLYGELYIEFETFSAQAYIYQPNIIAIDAKITAVVLEDIICNSLSVGIRVENTPCIIRLYTIYDNINVQKAVSRELLSFEEGNNTHKLIARYK